MILEGNISASGISAASNLPFYGPTIPGCKQAARARLPQGGDSFITWYTQFSAHC
jgi:hypothetical protein